ncbi:MAG: hypothetical protein MJ109_00390 [Kiritimatiellae bacterium]|nr:hypothetical protein [Kiritimatiellia bacterium]
MKKREGLAPFSVNQEGVIVETPITKALIKTILDFHKTWFVIEPIRPFVVMPDHIHLLIKLADIEKRGNLGRVVYQLMKALSSAYWRTEPPVAKHTSVGLEAGSVRPIFEREWHDWIIKRRGQLDAFIKYIRENPARHYRRQAKRDFFRVVPGVRFLGREWFAYGNLELLEAPFIEPFRCSRSIVEGSSEWLAVKERA